MCFGPTTKIGLLSIRITSTHGRAGPSPIESAAPIGVRIALLGGQMQAKVREDSPGGRSGTTGD